MCRLAALAVLAAVPITSLVWQRLSRRVRPWFRRLRLCVRFAVASARLSEAAVAQAAGLNVDRLVDALHTALRGNGDDDDSAMTEEQVLAIDVGGTRTKFLLCAMPLRGSRGSARVRVLPPVPTAQLWQNPQLETVDKFDPEGAPRRFREYLRGCGVESECLDRLVFAVPGTVDLTTDERSEHTVVKNAPSMSPRFRGFDFKLSFREVCPLAKARHIFKHGIIPRPIPIRKCLRSLP